MTVGWGSKLAKVRRGEISVVCSLMDGAVGVEWEEVEGVGDCGRLLEEDNAISRDAFEISTVGDNKDNLAKGVDGEEMDAGDVEVDGFLDFLDLRREGTGGGGMMAESGIQ